MSGSEIMRCLDPRSRRSVWLVTARSVDDWPTSAPWDSERFALFVAVDQVIATDQLAVRALEQGLAAVSAWGPGCAEIEDAFDDAIVGDGSNLETVDNVIVTTSHRTDSLADALEFFLDVLVPARDHVDRCDVRVVLAIGDVANRVLEALRDRGATLGHDLT